MKTLLLFVALLSLAACGGSGGGFVVVEEFSDCPLCKAAKDGDLERIQFLLDNGENPNAVSQSVNANPKTPGGVAGDSALLFAVFAGRTDIVKALLDGGADANQANKNGSTPLSSSTNHSSGEITMMLLDAGANPNSANIEGMSALMFATIKGHSEVAKMLLDAGANPNSANNKGITPLMWSAYKSHPEVAQILLDGGANPNVANNDGGTALMMAAIDNYVDVAKVLIAAGANLNAVQKDGWTALNIVASKGQSQVAKILLECGASPDIRNNEGKNAWHWANQQPIMHAIFYKHLAEVKAGKDIKPCLQKEVAAAPPPKGENIAEKVFENAWRSVVVVKSGGRQGSGVIVRPNAVATNCHVIDGGDIVVHKTGDRRALTDSAFAASVRRRDTERDFCLLDVAGLWGIPAGIRAYGSLKVGEDVYALGAPQGLDLSLSAGVISQLRQGRAVRYIQTDAAISPGSSGGGLFDSNANLIGILTAKIASENVEGIGFAIPADLATTP